ncbi:uncharacterized protein LOC135342530 [Halichondria panicea]|uniref:uncharacterized protein LOC135342530 n=1 Tax=Halichondria panicea TaxID=6063 RepID=UPI00312B3ED5
MEVSMLLSLPTEVLLQITDYLPAYDKLCLRISCKRFYSLLSDPCAWSSLVWKNCRRRERDFKALRLALKLSRSYVQYVHISYMPKARRFPNAKFFPQLGKCKQIRYLSLTGTFFKYVVKQNTLEQLLSELPSLYCLSVTGNDSYECCAIKAAKASKSLEVICINTGCDHGGMIDAVSVWKSCGYMPPNLKVLCSDLIVNHFYMIIPQLTSSDHPAQLSIYPNCSPIAGNMVNKYPILSLSLYPNVELVATCPTASVCSSAPHFSNLILSCSNSSSQDPLSATLYNSYNNMLSHTCIAVSFFPSSIESLYLRTLKKLASAELTLISELCPKLICLDIQDCADALSSLLGLADISSNCMGLAALNIKGIRNIESVSSLWEVLSSMRKLRYLSLGYSFLAERNFDRWEDTYLAKMNLFAINITSAPVSGDNVALQVERLLPALQQLQHLKITILGKPLAPLDLTNILPNLPCLTQIFIEEFSSYGGLLTLPTDTNCYSSLKRLYINYPDLDFSDDLARALSLSPSLTYLHLKVKRLSPLFREVVCNCRRLCECHIREGGHIGCEVQGLSTVLDKLGICGRNTTKETSLFIKNF